jgi:hypothetical protein
LLRGVVIARLLGALGLVALVVVAAGCGSTKAPAVASIGPATTTTASPSSGNGSSPKGTGSILAFARCMQKRGVNVQVGNGGRTISISGTPKSSGVFGKAQAACQKLMPGGGPKALTPAQQAQAIQSMRKLSICMRKNGVPNFPDPGANGLQLNASPTNGLNPRSPQFQAAMNKCAGGGPKGKGPFGFSVHVAKA